MTSTYSFSVLVFTDDMHFLRVPETAIVNAEHMLGARQCNAIRMSDSAELPTSKLGR